MTGWRVYPALLALVAFLVAGCGPPGPELAPPAQPGTLELGWVERDHKDNFTFRVDRLVIGDEGWSANVSVQNGSQTPFRLQEGSVGLVLLDTRTMAEVNRLTGDLEHPPPALKPDGLRPPPPAVLGPGAVWRGTMIGSEELRQGSVVRVLFGPYSSAGERFRSEATEFFWVTDQSVRLR
ncbi:MAG TPA: hypothetical protein VHI55_00525 [Gaiellaceae bacterium]|nr:hypothetical protein [Gaiellaceae bacterium]